MLRKIKLATAVSLALASMNVCALSIGEVKVKSFIGEPLLATVKSNTECMTIQASDDQSYVKGTVTMIGKGLFEIKSSMPLIEPIAYLNLKAGCHGEPVVSRDFSLIIDSAVGEIEKEDEPKIVELPYNQVDKVAKKASKHKHKVAFKPKTPAKESTDTVASVAEVKAKADVVASGSPSKEVKSVIPEQIKKISEQPVPSVKVADVVTVVAPEVAKGATDDKQLPVAPPVVEAVATPENIEMPLNGSSKPEEGGDVPLSDAQAPEVTEPEVAPDPVKEAPVKPVEQPIEQAESGVVPFLKEHAIQIGGGFAIILSLIGFYIIDRRKKKSRESWNKPKESELVSDHTVSADGIDLDDEDFTVDTKKQPDPKSSVIQLSSNNDESPSSVILNGHEMSDFHVTSPDSIFSWNKGDDDSDQPAMTVILADEKSK